VLVIFDTLARSMVGGDEYSARDMGEVVATLDRFTALGCAVMFTHHSGRGNDDHGRGSSALDAAVDTELRIEKRANDDTAITLKRTKQRNCREDLKWHLRRVDVEGSDSCVLKFEGVGRIVRRVWVPKGKQFTTLAALGRLTGNRPDSEIAYAVWCGKAKADGVGESTFNNARTLLCNNGLVVKDHEHYALTDEGVAILNDLDAQHGEADDEDPLPADRVLRRSRRDRE
jgi:hypothetical protein